MLLLLATLLLGAITPAQTQAQSKTLRAIDHARGLEDWCANARTEGRPGYLAPARSDLAGLHQGIEVAGQLSLYRAAALLNSANRNRPTCRMLTG
ncbi:MAG: hypothetical protein ACI9VR_001158 [Cognaticolwellia sp.]|jgi:hypothetical protein